MKRLWLLVFLLILAGCVSPSSDMPEYVVMLTEAWPNAERRCTAVAFSAVDVLTAAHCQDMTRIVTLWGQEAKVHVQYQYPDTDMVLLRADVPLALRSFARWGASDRRQPAQVYGNCPRYWSHIPRGVVYVRDEEIQINEMPAYHTQRWKSTTNQLCGGDSGGPVIQNGRVVGIVSAVETEVPWLALGTDIFVVPTIGRETTE